MATSYCDFVASLPEDTNSPHKHYHDKVYGFPITEDHELFERLVLEINQAGLSWTTILNKQAGFKQAYSQFNIAEVAAYGPTEVERLLQDKGIIRNRLKIAAAIHNAGVILELQQQFGSFYAWLLHHHPKTKAEWVKIFKAKFKFTGGEIVNEFLMSIGLLEGAHARNCPVYQEADQAGAIFNKQ